MQNRHEYRASIPAFVAGDWVQGSHQEESLGYGWTPNGRLEELPFHAGDASLLRARECELGKRAHKDGAIRPLAFGGRKIGEHRPTWRIFAAMESAHDGVRKPPA